MIIVNRDYLTLGPVPCDEQCQQVGTPSYNDDVARKECLIFKRQLERQFPNPPDLTYFRVRSFPHDFGTYREVCVEYNLDDEDSVEFALSVESNTPSKWDDLSLIELGKYGIFPHGENFKREENI